MIDEDCFCEEGSPICVGFEPFVSDFSDLGRDD